MVSIQVKISLTLGALGTEEVLIWGAFDTIIGAVFAYFRGAIEELMVFASDADTL